MTASPFVVCLVAFVILGSALCIRRLVTLVEVNGSSMSPDFEHGDRLLVVRRGAFARLRRGRAVVIDRTAVNIPGETHTGRGLFVKRLVALPGDRIPAPFAALPAFRAARRVPHARYLVLGAHPASADSKQWGYVRADDMCGVVIGRIGGSRSRSRGSD
ncbi:S26 family signal peptidase [Streptomyces sp. NPDC090077]|uniref:S26 family signal peptidase n=1 Tax=Streptomyces sp. NPDC090077 TaxID=3365938 RepID=UPI003805AD60